MSVALPLRVGIAGEAHIHGDSGGCSFLDAPVAFDLGVSPLLEALSHLQMLFSNNGDVATRNLAAAESLGVIPVCVSTEDVAEICVSQEGAFSLHLVVHVKIPVSPLLDNLLGMTTIRRSERNPRRSRKDARSVELSTPEISTKATDAKILSGEYEEHDQEWLRSLVTSDDRDSVFRAVGIQPGLFRQASPKFKADREIAIKAVSGSSMLSYTAPHLKADKELVLAAVTKHGASLKYADPALCDDRDIVLAAVAQDGTALKFASDGMKRNPEIVLAASAHHTGALKHASTELRAQYDFIYQALQQQRLSTDPGHQGSFALDHASKELQRHPELMRIVQEMREEREDHQWNQSNQPHTPVHILGAIRGRDRARAQADTLTNLQ